MGRKRTRTLLARLSLGVVLTLLAAIGLERAFPGAAQPRLAGKPNQGADVRQLIEDLGSPSYRTREAADRRLGDMGESVLPALRKGTNSADAEVRRRCARLIRQVEDRAAAAVIARWRKKNIPDFLARLATDKQFATPEHLRELWALVEFLAGRASEVSGRRFRPPPLNVAALRISRKNNDAFVQETALLLPVLTCPRDGSRVYRGILLRDSLLVTGPPPYKSRKVAGLEGVYGSVAFVEGDLGYCVAIRNSVVVCQGNIPNADIKNSIVLTTGRLAGLGVAENNFLEVGDFGRCTFSGNNVYMNLKTKLRATRSQNDLFFSGPSILKVFERSR